MCGNGNDESIRSREGVGMSAACAECMRSASTPRRPAEGVQGETLLTERLGYRVTEYRDNSVRLSRCNALSCSRKSVSRSSRFGTATGVELLYS